MESLETGGKSKQEIAVQALKEGGSLSLTSLFLEGLGYTADKLPMKPLTWNENAGVIVVADSEGKRFAIPSSEQSRDALSKSGLEKDESVGVPNLNEANMWNKNEAVREQNSGFQRWRSLASEAKPVQDLETQAQIEASRLAREALSSEQKEKDQGRIDELRGDLGIK